MELMNSSPLPDSFSESPRAERRAFKIALFAIAEAIARVGPSSILDASSWTGCRVRYLFPVVPAFAAFGFIGGMDHRATSRPAVVRTQLGARWLSRVGLRIGDISAGLPCGIARAHIVRRR